MVSELILVKEYIFDVYIMIWPIFDLQMQDGCQFWAPKGTYFQNLHRAFILGSNESSAHDELNNIQYKYTEVISEVNKVIKALMSFAVQASRQGEWIHFTCRTLIQFNELGLLPSTFPIGRLDEGHGIEAAMVCEQSSIPGWSTMKPCWKEQKNEHAVKVLLKNQNAKEGPNLVILLKWNRTSVSSADSLLAMKAFVRLQHFNWIIGCALLHPYFKTQNYLGDLVLGTWWPLKLSITLDA